MRDKRIPFCLLILINLMVMLCVNFAIAQDLTKRESLLKESKALIYSKPNDALKIAQHLLNGNISDSERTQINFLIAEIYKVKGDYNNGLNYLFLADENTSGLPVFDKIQILISKSSILSTLYLDKQSKEYHDEAVVELTTVKNLDELAFLRTSIILEEIKMLLDRQNYQAAFKKLENQKAIFEKNINRYPNLNVKYFNLKGKINFGLGKYDEAIACFDQALLLIEKQRERNIYGEFSALTEMATVKFHKKDSQEGTRDLLKALKIANNLQNLYFIDTANKLLVANYIVLNDSANYKLYNQAFLKTQSELENTEQESVNTAYNLIVKEHEKKYGNQRKNYFTKLYVSLSLLLVVLVVCGFVWFKFYWEKKRLKEIISYLEVTRNNFIIRFTEKKDTGKKFFVPQDTEQLLLGKLKRFENSTRFTNKDMSLAVLAGYFETNTKYLSEVINKHYSVNFNTYINKLRINFIVEKLKTDPNYSNYKISYLAETSGFSSHSSFATVFKSITGIAPITFIELLKDEKEIANLEMLP